MCSAKQLLDAPHQRSVVGGERLGLADQALAAALALVDGGPSPRAGPRSTRGWRRSRSRPRTGRSSRADSPSQASPGSRRRPRRPWRGSSRRTCAGRCPPPRRCPRSSPGRSRAPRTGAARRRRSPLSCALLALSQAGVGHRRSVYLVDMQQAQLCIGCNIAASVQSSPEWHHLLGNLAAAAASHWKRSLAIVVAVLVALGVLAGVAGGSFTDDFSSPGTGSQQAMDLLEQRFPAQSGDTATVVFAVEDGNAARRRAPAGDRRRAEGDPPPAARHRGSRPADEPKGQVSRDGRIAFATVQYDQPGDRPRQGAGPAPGRGDRGQGRARRHRGLAPRPDRRPGRAADGAGRRADRGRGRRHRAHARLPLRRGDAADAVRLAARRWPAGSCC